MAEYRPSDIILVRHGESVWNAHGRENKKRANPPRQMEGIPDHKTPLTDRGCSQASETGWVLSQQIALETNGRKVPVVYHSPYVRTTQTAERIAQALQCERLYRDLNLVEQNFGWLDAGVYPNREEFLEMQDRFSHLRNTVGKFYAKPPHGESWCDVARRTHDFLGKLFRPKWHEQPIVVVSHAVTIATFLYHLAGRDEEETVEYYQRNELDNCGVTHFRYDPAARWNWDLLYWNKVLY